MHWRGHWWGTEIVSDTDSDEIFLKELFDKLHREPIVSYDGGGLEPMAHAFTGDGGPEGGFTLVFNR